MDPFVRDLLALPTLDAAHERALARRARLGDPFARDDLIKAGMRSVAQRALLRGHRGEELRDAVQSGAVGLIRAVDRYDPDRGARLATYAWHWIGSAMTLPIRQEVPLTDAGQRAGDVAWPPESAEFDLLEGLPDELSSVLQTRYGLGGSSAQPLSRRLVAEQLGLTVAQVREREAKAMRHVRARLAKVVHRAPPSGAGPL